MSNPQPRAALRKAPDSALNPALPGQAIPSTQLVGTVDLRNSAQRAEPKQQPDVVDVRPDRTEPTAKLEADSAQADRKSKGKRKKNKRKAEGSEVKEQRTGASTKSKKGKKAKKHRKRAEQLSAKLTLSKGARRKLRTGSKARGSGLDETVEALVTDLKGTSPAE